MEDTGIKIGKILLQSGIITNKQFDEIKYIATQLGGRFEELVIEKGYINEDQLLKTLAKYYKTKFVTTEKLSKAMITANLLKMIPFKLAEKYMIIPLLFNPKEDNLMVATADMEYLKLIGDLNEIEFVAGVKKISFFIARYGAVLAAIDKYYKGISTAFSRLDVGSVDSINASTNLYQQNLMDESSIDIEYTSFKNVKSTAKEENIIAEPKIKNDENLKEQSLVTNSDYLETVNILVGLIESIRGELKGHSNVVSHYLKEMCSRLGLPNYEKDTILLSGLIHDLGKGSPYHLTAFNVANWDVHKHAAMKKFDIPIKIFETIHMPKETKQIILSLYERYDGTGFPDKLSGKDIPIGSRMLALVETFTDLTLSKRNPFRKRLSTEEALQIISNERNKIFDPDLVDLLKIILTGAQLKQKLLGEERKILLVDSDPDQISAIEYRLSIEGYIIKVARTADQALKIANEEKPSVIISEVDLQPFDGFELIRKIQENSQLNDTLFIFHSTRGTPEDVGKGLELGAADYVSKPASIGVILVKLNRLFTSVKSKSGNDGVSGSLSDMAITDLVQIINQGRKTGNLYLDFEKFKAEIHFKDGNIVNVIAGNLKGEEAFFSLLEQEKGTFYFDTKFIPKEKNIYVEAETLLLEGLRRMDEKKAGVL